MDRQIKPPMQPIVIDDRGVYRFLENRIISRLVDHGRRTGYGLNEIAHDFHNGIFNVDEQMQLSQLIGYSIEGYGTLSYVSDESYEEALEQKNKLQEIIDCSYMDKQAPKLRDAYDGAREDLAIWKRRALEAERDLRKERESNERFVASRLMPLIAVSVIAAFFCFLS